MKFRFTIIALLFLVLRGFSQNGIISGTISVQDNGELVIGAVVIVDSLPKYGAVTDFDGKYTIKIPAGSYKITCHYTGYAAVSFLNVKVTAGQTTPLDFVLSAPLDTNIVEVIGIRETGTINAVLDTIHKGNGAVDGLDKKTISQTTETTAGGVAKKIPGVTIVDGRFIVVRGLSERYNAVLLNNVFAPSAETDVKAFAFDLVPSSMIDNFMVYKSPSPDLPGEFAGGVIRITTTDIPDHNVFHVGYAGGFRSGTTLQPFNMNKGTGSDFFAAGAGSRGLPGNFPTTAGFASPAFNAQAQMEAGKSLSNNWLYATKNAPADIRFNMAWEHRYSKPGTKEKNGFQFGNITAVNYSNTYSYYISNRLDYNAYDSINQKSDTIFYYTDSVYTNSTRMALVQNNAIRFGKGGSQRITLKNLFNQMGDNETTLRGGINHEFGTRQKEYSYRYTQRSIYTGQLNGLHQFNNKNTVIDWTAAYSLSRRSDPDWRKARYTQDISAPTDPYYLYIANSPSPSFLGRIFINMHEDIIAGAANYTQAIFLRGDSTSENPYSFTLKTGIYIEQKERTYTVRNLGYVYNQATSFDWDITTMPLDSVFLPQHINDSDGIKIADATKKADQYFASNSLQAGYLMAIVPFGNFKGKVDEKNHERVRISTGVRFERNVQRLNSNTIQDDTVIVNNDILRILPSINVAWNFSDRMLARASYGRTLNRPEFREIAPLYFYDFLFNSINTGNSALKTPSIENYDLRWEFYPRSGENITVGAFYKKFTNPIEVYFIPGVGSGGTRSFTWGNAPEAHNYGIEIEMRKKLDSINVPFIRNLSIVANAALIKSEINLTDENIGLVSNKRPMMGQSPYIVNAGLFYQNDSLRLRVNVMYNVIGPRIVIVGVPGVPEVYEMPRSQLDIAIIKTIGKKDNIDFRLNISDLLNQETLLLQDANADGKLDRNTDQRMQFYKRGTYFTFGVNVRIL
ncbi:MAG: TonB-dependent receptor [Bacteroidota bacterium]|nr:TonB-dependent receptor [Bacteroidota bacterium]